MKKIVVIVAVITILSVVGFGVTFAASGFDTDILAKIFTADDDFTKIDKEFVPDDFANINARGNNERILLENHDGDTVWVSYFVSDYKKTTVAVEDGELKLKSTYNWKKVVLRPNNQTKKTNYIRISLPKSYTGGIDLETKNYCIMVNAENTFESVKLKTSNEEIRVDGITSLSTTNISTTNDIIRITNCNFSAGDTVIKTKDSDIGIANSVFAAVDISTTNDMIMFAGVTADKITANTTNGQIQISADGCPYVKAKTTNAEVVIRIKGDKNDYETDLKTTNDTIWMDYQNLSKNNHRENIGASKYLYAHTTNASVHIEIYLD